MNIYYGDKKQWIWKAALSSELHLPECRSGSMAAGRTLLRAMALGLDLKGTYCTRASESLFRLN